MSTTLGRAPPLPGPVSRGTARTARETPRSSPGTRRTSRSAARGSPRPWTAPGRPPLRMFDRFGNRIDEVVFPPEYRELVTKGYEAGVVFKAVEEGDLVASYQVGYVTSFYDAGLYCPHTVSLVHRDPARQVRLGRASREVPPEAPPAGRLRLAGGDLDDRGEGGLRPRLVRRDGRPSRRGPLAPDRREVLHEQRRRRAGDRSGPPRGRAGRRPRPRALPRTAAARRRHAQLPSAAAEGQDRHPLRADRRGRAGRQRRVPPRRARPGDLPRPRGAQRLARLQQHRSRRADAAGTPRGVELRRRGASRSESPSPSSPSSRGRRGSGTRRSSTPSPSPGRR